MSIAKRNYRIAVIPGDGIGTEVVPEGLRALGAASKRFGYSLSWEQFDFASWRYYERHGRMLPEDWKQTLGGFDAIYFGAVGWPDKMPDHVSLWGSLLEFRRGFDQYVNLRPIRVLMEESPVLKGRTAQDVDFLIVRENTEGEYSSIGGRMYAGTEREIAIQETVMSRVGVDRVVRYAFELAQRRTRRQLMSATKSNGISIAMPFWDERVAAIATDYPEVAWGKAHIDILAANFVLHPDHFDVVVASNLFGDILSDLGAACAGTIGIAPSGNINPERAHPSLFEPVHGSAPDIAGRGIANPIGQIWAGAMMLDHLGEAEAAASIVEAIRQVLADPRLRTADLGGSASTTKCGTAIASAIR
jgi:tartrate dehydrogenase/decarboxylase/D-malate dehydrogenase